MVANAGGTLGLAVFAIWMLNKVWQDRLKKQEEANDEMRQMRDRMQECVEESTTVIAANTEVLRANTEAMTANREVTRQLLEFLRARKVE